MWRSVVYASLNTSVPALSLVFWTWTGPLKVRIAFLSHSSPLTLGDIAKQSKAKQNDSEIDLAILVIFPLCVLRILKDPMAARFCLRRRTMSCGLRAAGSRHGIARMSPKLPD